MNKSRKNKKNSSDDGNDNFLSKEDRKLIASARIASSKAIRSSKALGITIKVIKNHQIIAISPDKSEKVIREISKPAIDISSLRKGMILERK